MSEAVILWLHHHKNGTAAVMEAECQRQHENDVLLLQYFTNWRSKCGLAETSKGGHFHGVLLGNLGGDLPNTQSYL